MSGRTPHVGGRGMPPRASVPVRVLRWLFPDRKRDWPPPGRIKRMRGFIIVGAAAVLTVSGIAAGPQAVARARCAQWPWSDIWNDAGECVGVSTGSYDFGAPFQGVMRKIGSLNTQEPCAGSGSAPAPVNVGVLVTLNSLNTGIRAVHELEGFAAALQQSQQQGTHAYISACPYEIRLDVAQMGDNEQAAVQDARILAGRHVEAVVGMGLSSEQSALAAVLLDQDQIPMVADVITAEGFDQNGSAADHPDFSSCRDPGQSSAGPRTYEQGLGQEFFRVAPRNYQQVNTIATYIASIHPAGPRFIVEPDDTTDPYNCTTLPLIATSLSQGPAGNQPFQLYFDSGDSGIGQGEPAQKICQQTEPVTVFYAARAVELGTFLSDLIRLRNQDDCDPRPITILSLSDAAQLRVQAPTPGLEAIREQVLRSGDLAGNWLRLLYTPLADPDLLSASPPPGYQSLADGMRKEGFPIQDLADGWAIMSYDALAAVATALGSPQMATLGSPQIAASQLQSVLDSGLHIAGADGTFWFDSQDAGNRSGPSPVLVRLCPSGDQVTTVPVQPGTITSCSN